MLERVEAKVHAGDNFVGDNQESLSLTNVGLRPNFAVRACCKTRFRPRGITFDCPSMAQDPVRLAVRRATATSLGSRYFGCWQKSPSHSFSDYGKRNK